MKAMILAAGLGTRLRPVTEMFAKPAVPFLNIPLLYYSIALMEQAGIKSLVLNTHHLPEQIEKLAQEIPGAKFDVEISPEPGTPLGSGGGIWKARKHLEGGGDFLIANGDEVILPHDSAIMPRFLKAHKDHAALATILVMKHPLVGTQFGGVWADRDGNVKGFGKDASKFPGCTGYHYIGLQILNDRIFDYLPDGESNILYDALAEGIAKGETVRIVNSDFTWFETGNPKDFLHATGEALNLLKEAESGSSKTEAQFLLSICKRFWAQFASRPSLWRGHDSQVAASAVERGSIVLTGKGVQVDPGAIVRGFVVLGDGVRVESRASVENSVVLANSTVKSTDMISGEIVLPK